MTAIPSIIGDDAPLTLPRRLLGLLNGAVGSIALTLVATILLGLLWVGPSFFAASNTSIVAASVAVPLIVAMFASLPLLAGTVDLSIGSMVGLGGVIFNQLYATGMNGWLAGGIAVVVGAVSGAVNAWAVVGLGAEPLAVTLGSLTLLRGLCQVLVVNAPPTTLIDGLYDVTSGSVLGGPPALFFIGLGLALLTAAFVTKTRTGRRIQAVGGDARAAARAGIPVNRIRTICLIVSGAGAGLGGVLYVGQLGSASNSLGFGLEFQTYAALMIGGYSITRGGVGNPLGGLLGLLVVAGITNILNVQFIDANVLNVIVAVILLAAVLVDRLRGGDSFE
jgi:ribose/xylose/arabinose/galactoside ABC-type transport system permease subunit